MKHILLIENETVDNDILRFIDSLKKDYTLQNEESTVHIIDRLRFDDGQMIKLKETLKTYPITDVVFFTTWLYSDMTRALYNIIKNVPQVLNIYSLSEHSVTLNILKAIEIEIETKKDYDEYLACQKHNVYHGYFLEDVIKEDWITEHEILDEFLELEEQRQYELEEKQKTDNILKIELDKIMKYPTKEYVEVLNIRAYGGKWGNLKKGDIVPILNTPSTDNCPLWGVWVAGKDEPVKLLNSDFNMEYKYLGIKKENGYKLTANGIAKEIVSCMRNTGLDKNVMVNMLTVKINGKLGWDNEDTLHSWLTYNILDFAEIPRRLYRNHFEDQLTKYYKNYTYFKELDPSVESKYIQTM